MKLIARKACSFSGKKFFIGDEIPAEFVLNPKAQESMGTLAIVADGAGATHPAKPVDIRNEIDTMTVVIHAKEGDLPLALTKEGLQNVVDVLTGKATDAEEVIAQMTDGDALILVHIADSRKAIKVAAEARAQAINDESENPDDPEESAGDQ